MSHVFISYSHHDRAVARRIVDGLKAAGLTVWWDEHLRSGESFDDKLEAALRAAGAVVVLWSGASVQSRWVRAEATLANRLGTLVPVMVEPCERPIIFELTLTVDLSDWNGDRHASRWLAFVNDVRHTVDRAGMPAAAADGQNGKPAPGRPAPAGIDSAERRRVTVLRCNFAETGQGHDELDPEEFDAFQQATDAVLKLAINALPALLFQRDSSGFSCAFGVPVAIEDDEVFAAEAAFRLAARLRAECGLDVKMGLASGVALVTFDTGSSSFQITGGLTVVADELARQAAAGDLLIAAATRTRLAPYFVTRDVGAAVFAVEARTTTRTRIDAAQRVGFSPLIGRQLELTVVETALEEAVAGQGRVVLLRGEPGAGKSRLVFEFHSHCLDQDLEVVQSRCDMHDRTKPHLPFIAMLQTMITRDCNADIVTDTMLAEWVRAIDDGLQIYIPHLAHLLSLASTEHRLPEELDGVALRKALGEAIVALIITKSQRRPLVLIFDDWHWSDEVSAETMHRLVEACAFHPVLVAVCARPETLPAWSALPHCIQVTLKPLSRTEVAELVRTMARAEDVADDLVSVLHSRTDGIPLFVEELTRSLLEQDRITLQGNRLTAGKGLDIKDLPGSIEAVVRSRLDRLDRGLLDFLRVAAVIGRHFETGFLIDHFGDAERVNDWLKQAIAEGLVQQTKLIPAPEYRFRHVLNQVVAYDSLLLKQRRAIHRSYGEWLEARTAADADTSLDALAHHFLQAGEDAKAILYLDRAGKRAAGAASYRVASEFLRSAVGLLDKQPPSPDRDTQLLDVLNTLISSVILTDGYAAPEARKLSERLRSIADTVPPGLVHFTGLHILCRYFYNHARLQEAGELADRMLAMAVDADDPGLELAARCAQGVVLLQLGYPLAARQTLEIGCGLWTIETERDLAVRFGESPTVKSFVQLGTAMTRVGDCAAGLKLFDKGLEISKQLNHPVSQIGALTYLEGSLAYIEDWAGSTRAGAQAQQLATKYELRHWLTLSHRFDCFKLIAAGKREEGIAALRQSLAAVEAMGVMMVMDGQLLLGAQIAAQVGEWAEARAYLEQARALVERFDMRQLEANIERAALRLNWDADPEAALASARIALESATSRHAVVAALVLGADMAQRLQGLGRTDEALTLMEPIWAAVTSESHNCAPLFVRIGKLMQDLRTAVATPVLS